VYGGDVLVLTSGGDVAPLRLNFLQPLRGVLRIEWVDSVAVTISAGFPVRPSQGDGGEGFSIFTTAAI